MRSCSGATNSFAGGAVRSLPMADQGRTHPLAAFVAGLVFNLAACDGGSGDPYRDGQDALGRGNHAAALEHFDAALEKLPPEDSRWLPAKLGQIGALARVDGERAESESLALLTSHHEALGERGARALVIALVDGGAFEAAFEFLKATVPIWPSSEALDAAWGAVEMRAARSASPDQLKDLRGLGYVDAGGGGKSASRRPGSQTATTTAPPK